MDELLNCDPNIKAAYSKIETSITTDASIGHQLGYTDEGYIIHLDNGDIVNATCQPSGKIFTYGPSTVYYSKAVLNGSETKFPYIYKQSILVHELAHAYHNTNPNFFKEKGNKPLYYARRLGGEHYAYEAQNIYLLNHGLKPVENPHFYFINSALNLPPWFPK